HEPQSMVFPHPSPCLPHVAPRSAHVFGLHKPPGGATPIPHLLGPPPPQNVPCGHSPHGTIFPQPSPCGPHSKPSSAHVFGTHSSAVPKLVLSTLLFTPLSPFSPVSVAPPSLPHPITVIMSAVHVMSTSRPKTDGRRILSNVSEVEALVSNFSVSI